MQRFYVWILCANILRAGSLYILIAALQTNLSFWQTLSFSELIVYVSTLLLAGLVDVQYIVEKKSTSWRTVISMYTSEWIFKYAKHFLLVYFPILFIAGGIDLLNLEGVRFEFEAHVLEPLFVSVMASTLFVVYFLLPTKYLVEPKKKAR